MLKNKKISLNYKLKKLTLKCFGCFLFNGKTDPFYNNTDELQREHAIKKLGEPYLILKVII
jgi:hypothetical protein